MAAFKVFHPPFLANKKRLCQGCLSIFLRHFTYQKVPLHNEVPYSLEESPLMRMQFHIGKGKIRKLNRSSMNQKFSNTTGSKRLRSGKVARVRPLFSFTFTKTVSKQDDVQEPVHCETHPISCACCATFSPVSKETGMWKCSVCLVWIYCPSANQAFPTSLSSSCAPSIHARGRFHTFLSCHARHPGGYDLILVGHTAKSGFS